MSRDVRSRGAQWPSGIQSVRTFDSNFTYDESMLDNGIDYQVYQHQCFPWLATANESDTVITDSEREFLMSAPDDSGNDVPIRVTPQSTAGQTNINAEMSAIVWRCDWDRFNLPKLAQIMQEASTTFLRLSAYPTPSEIEDNFVAFSDTFIVESVDQAASTITLTGQPYYRKRNASALNSNSNPLYSLGPYSGMQRYMRDQLTSDAERSIDEFKAKEYDYGFIETAIGRLRYTSVVDSPERDQRQVNNNIVPDSQHTLSILEDISGISAGDQITLMRRLPYLTTMFATIGTFSQIGGFWDFRIRFDAKRRQFSAAFLWSNYRETDRRGYPQHWKEVEFDVAEYPAATFIFMNMHRPYGRVEDPPESGLFPHSMLDYAANNNLTPSLEGSSEWSEDIKQQHQLFIPFDSPDYVDPTQFHTVRFAMWAENNPYGRPANTGEWYVQVPDGRFLYTAGALMSPDAHDGFLDALQVYLCNPVDGDFVADMEFFAPGAASTDETMPINFDIEFVRANQFQGGIAGGSGLPDPSGVYPNGFKATPNDITGNSGIGLVNAISTEVVGNQVLISGFNEIGIKNDGGKLLEVVTE